MCSRVFFRKVKARRAISKVYQIRDGVLLTDRQDISHEFISFYERLLGGEQSASPVSLEHLTPYLKHRLRPDEADRMVAPIIESDIKLALFSIPDDKASGPDGYSSCFFKRAWLVIGPEVTLAIQEFFNYGGLLKQINATLLCLIPKVQLPSGVTDFRPISCCNILYKMITKILVSRLALILDKLVQAFDSVNWGFLQAALTLFNLPPQFLQWITECVTTPSFSISLNGGICGFFKGAWGLRQGDPLSPYLFVIVMEVLNISMTSRIQQYQCFSYHWRCKEVALAMLCFADDLLLFSKADPHSISLLKEVLDGFGVVSGLVANAAKSHVILSRSAMELAPTILAITGFQLGSLPFRYLGLPIVSSKLTIVDCQPLLLKVDERISGWGSYQLSFAARTQLIRLHSCSLRDVAANGHWSWKRMIKLLPYLRTMLQFLVGNGESFWLWSDPWHSLGALGAKFPRAPMVTGLPKTSELSMVISEGNWNWPSPTSTEVMTIMEQLPPIHVGEDRILWKNSSGVFSTSSAYKLFTTETNKVSWFALLRGPFKIPRNLFILWLTILDKLSTGDKAWLNIPSPECCLCSTGELEDRSHIYFQCSFTRQCLIILKAKVKFIWPHLDWDRGLQWAQTRLRGRHLITATHRATLASLVYHIWRERNKRRFVGTETTPVEVAHMVETQVRLRIQSENLSPNNVQTSVLFRIWKITV
ncbi:UNVERIFIED_CONTAM: LINE-1 retrotransposable element O protein [Sesamum latifolium]|uniref:LINE-1 retrotransposable element O protein n=1 Tax=Sesamum latifolium TaxID=2727402 RepID=A0AAW2WX04_9LAMI